MSGGCGMEESKLLEVGGAGERAVSSRLFQAVVGLVLDDVPVGFGQNGTVTPYRTETGRFAPSQVVDSISPVDLTLLLFLTVYRMDAGQGS